MLWLLAGLLLPALMTKPGLAQTPVEASTSDEALLTLDVSEQSALVSIDGLVKGVTPLTGPLTLPVGRHRLELFKAGFQRETRELDLQAGPQAMSLTLEAEQAKLSVTSASLPAELFIDGQGMGPLPWSGQVSPGEHVLSAQSATAKSAELRTNVSAGGTTLVKLSLVPRTASIVIDVPQAAISIDGRRVAVGAWAGNVSPGKHRVELERAGFRPKVFEVTLAADQTRRLADSTWEASSTSQPRSHTTAESRGVYGQIGLLGLFSRSTTDELRRKCPAATTTPGGRCEWHSSYGGGLALRVGYSFGWFAFEGLALGGADGWYDKSIYTLARTRDESDFYGPARTERYTFLRYGAAFGVGARFFSPTRVVRATLGVNLGLLRRWERYFRVASATTSVTTALGTSTLPDANGETSAVDRDTSGLFVVDGGVLLGSTPGLKLHLGMLLAASFGSASKVKATHSALGRDPLSGTRGPYGSGALEISHGTQVFFGPILGVQFGY
jgi:hypothetical protein